MKRKECNFEYIITLDGVHIPSIATAAKILGVTRESLQVKLKRRGYYLKDYINNKVIIIKLFEYKEKKNDYICSETSSD
jgi:predicted HTH domain antitoxin